MVEIILKIFYTFEHLKRRLFFKKFIIANLKGMNEKFMNNITNIQKAEYIPYGKYSEMIPYLTRRLYENIDQIKYSLL